jgi:hypothetical protein
MFLRIEGGDRYHNNFPNPDWLPIGDSYIFTLIP